MACLQADEKEISLGVIKNIICSCTFLKRLVERKAEIIPWLVTT